MSYLFGDFEPEDAWDNNDSVLDLIRNLCLRLALLGLFCRLREEASDEDRLRESAELLSEWRKRADPTRREAVRAEEIARHIRYLRDRIAA